MPIFTLRCVTDWMAPPPTGAYLPHKNSISASDVCLHFIRNARGGRPKWKTTFSLARRTRFVRPSGLTTIKSNEQKFILLAVCALQKLIYFQRGFQDFYWIRPLSHSLSLSRVLIGVILVFIICDMVAKCMQPDRNNKYELFSLITNVAFGYNRRWFS